MAGSEAGRTGGLETGRLEASRLDALGLLYSIMLRQYVYNLIYRFVGPNVVNIVACFVLFVRRPDSSSYY